MIPWWKIEEEVTKYVTEHSLIEISFIINSILFTKEGQPWCPPLVQAASETHQLHAPPCTLLCICTPNI